MYVKTSANIKVQIEPAYMQEKSDPPENNYVWSYNVVIENQGDDTVQLVSRHLLITDALGRSEEVHSYGVVGEQPTFPPGEKFGYESGVSLVTPSGIVSGCYTFEKKNNGHHFDVDIPAFSLDCPYQIIRQH